MQVDNGTLKIINLDRWRTDGEKTDHTVYGLLTSWSLPPVADCLGSRQV